MHMRDWACPHFLGLSEISAQQEPVAAEKSSFSPRGESWAEGGFNTGIEWQTDSTVPTLYPVGGKAATGAGTRQLGCSGVEFQVQRKPVGGLCRGGECTC